MDRSAAATFAGAGGAAGNPAAGNDGNDLLTYELKCKRHRKGQILLP